MLQIYSLLLLVAFTFTDAEPTLPAQRGVITPFAKLNDELPFNFGILEPRQGRCQDSTETPCADGNGCCPYGQACAYTTSGGQQYGICQGGCGFGAVTCTTPITACCNNGERCGNDGLCTKAGFTLSSLAPVNTFTATGTGLSITTSSRTFASITTENTALASLSQSLASYSSAVQASRSSLSAAASLSSLQASISSAQASLSRSLSAAAASSAAGATASSGSARADGARTINGPGWKSVFSIIGMLFGLV